MITCNQLVAHVIGDYLVQSHWMAVQKTKSLTVALIHGVSYCLPFVLFMLVGWLPLRPKALVPIAFTHAAIDRWRLARYVVWIKNQLAPAPFRGPWKDAQATGNPPDSPLWLAGWLMIIADNTLHVLINALCLHYLK